MKISFITCISSVLAGTITIETHRDKSTSDNLGRGNTLFRDIHLRNIRSTSHSVGEPLADAINEFYATLYVGSNHQKVVPMIDTGSSDLWIMESSNPYCANNTDCIGMEFNSSASTTFKNTTKPWKIEYMDTSGAFGFLCQDTVEIGDTSVPDTYFAVADIANSTEGVFGIGYEYNEAPNIVSGNDTYTYPNFPVHLKDTGIINTIAYSLYLNDLEAQEGALLFGGVDHAKYYGTLGIVPIINMAPWAVDNPYSIYVMLDSISISSENSSCPLVSNMNFPVLFDSGSSLAILPNRTLSPMAQAYGYTWSEQDGFFKGECDMFDLTGLNSILAVLRSKSPQRAFSSLVKKRVVACWQLPQMTTWETLSLVISSFAIYISCTIWSTIRLALLKQNTQMSPILRKSYPQFLVRLPLLFTQILLRFPLDITTMPRTYRT